MIHIHNIDEWLDLLKESKEELLRIYGDRLVKGVPLYKKLDRAIKMSKEEK
tara:strand:- start:2544 stop:2696 length:153 start_codon:yes stop_codon:yes gene_type:complete